MVEIKLVINDGGVVCFVSNWEIEIIIVFVLLD